MTKNRIIPYKPYLKELARELRKNSTVAEIMLWEQIKGRRLGFQFHRQVPIDHFIVDFYCHELMLAIEIDGFSHDSQEAVLMDQRRQIKLGNLGVKFLRFDDFDVKNSIEHVVKSIENYTKQLGHPPSPPEGGSCYD